MPGFEEDRVDKRGSRDPNYRDPVPYELDPTKPPEWEENCPIYIDQPHGIWKVPLVYGPRKVLRFPGRPQIGRYVRWGVFKKPVPEEKWIDPRIRVDDPLEFTVRPPQHTAVPQEVDVGPPFHSRLHKAVASGDISHRCRIVDPEGVINRKKGGGWMCRKWVPRPMPRDLINHTSEEWEELLEKQAIQEAKEEAEFQELLHSVTTCMNNKDGVMKDTHDVLIREKNNHDDRQAAMYKLWEKQVFHNINNQIAKKLKRLSPYQIAKKLKYQQMRYAKAVNDKKIFRDIETKHYDPFELEGTGVHYNEKHLLDPMKHDLEKDKRERVFMGHPVYHKVHTKDVLDPTCWTYDKFRSTMHGHMNADNEDATYKPRKMIAIKWYSQPVFWNDKWGSEYWSEAFPPGGKGMPPKPPDNKEWVWVCGKDMVWDSPVKLQPKLVISDDNPLF